MKIALIVISHNISKAFGIDFNRLIIVLGIAKNAIINVFMKLEMPSIRKIGIVNISSIITSIIEYNAFVTFSSLFSIPNSPYDKSEEIMKDAAEFIKMSV